MAPFDPEAPVSVLPYLRPLEAIPSDIVADNDNGLQFHDFSQEEYYAYLEAIKRHIDGDESKKVVASRRLTVDCAVDPAALFGKLCHAYPNAFVFLVSLPQYGTWIGASPELLIRSRDGLLESMALAGTRAAGEDGVSWDRKNILEQRIVTDYIAKAFRSEGLNPEIGETRTVSAGPVEHLMTPVTAPRGEAFSASGLLSLLKALSPTPALSGYPKAEALSLIRRFEGDRSLYGGFAGPLLEEFSFYVVLRCAYLRPSTVTLFAGGGITAFSSLPAEWQETTHKFSTLLPLL